MVVKLRPLRSDRSSVPMTGRLNLNFQVLIIFLCNLSLWADKLEIIGKTKGISSSRKALGSLLSTLARARQHLRVR